MGTKGIGRKVAQVIYIAVALIFTFLVYVVAYNSGASTKYFDLLTTSAAAEDHSEMCKAFSMYNIPFDSVPVIESEGTENHLVIYNAINQLNLTYYDENSQSQNYAEIQYMYYVFIFNPTFDYATINGTTNGAGLVFYGGDNSYKFNYVVSDTINKDQYIATPTTAKDSLFHS